MESGIWWRRALLARGVSDDEVRRLVRSGSLVPVRRGAYTERLPDRPEDRHLLQAWAAARDLTPDAALSHASAAVVHRLDLWDVPLVRVHATRPRRSGARIGPEIHVHAAPLEPHEVVLIGGVRVTSVVRTVLDLARVLEFDHAVVVADSALRKGLVEPAALAAAAQVRRPGVAAARRAIGFADAGGGSPGESRSRVLMAAAGLPVPILQREIRSARSGAFIGEVDFWWGRVVGEFDGRIKYGRLLAPGQEPGDAVWKEKLREDALRAEGLAVVRWTWADLTNFDPVLRRLRELI